MLFSDQRKHKISLPTVDEERNPSNVAFLIRWLCDHLMKDPRKEMFVVQDSVWVSRVSFYVSKWLLMDQYRRPGVLVLINDADWELEGEESYVLQANDEIVFVSTLHGG